MNKAIARRNATLGVAQGMLCVLIFIMGRNSVNNSAPNIEPSNAASSVDNSAVAVLVGKLLENSSDSESLWALGNTYFSAANYVAAAPYYERLVKISPKDDGAWIAVGAAAFNSGDNGRAFEAWSKAASLNSKNSEAYYNLGFWYLNQNPAQQDKAAEVWQKVIDIDPTSDFAKDVMSRMASASTPKSTK
jgi:tetratricopeptide (TPR) repeat protein